MSKKIVRLLTIFLVLISICCLPVVLACNHENQSETITTSPACTIDGIETVTCDDCGEIIETRFIPASGHNWGDYVLIYSPNANGNGKEFCNCISCGLKQYRDVVCPHTETTYKRLSEPTCAEFGIEQFSCVTCKAVWEESVDKLPHEDTVMFTMKDASCINEGLERIICNICKTVAEERSTPKIECNYGDWNIVKYATPFESGEKYRICSVCGNKETEYYSIPMKNNSIYIPTADIFCDFAVTGFTQEAVDGNDVVYTNSAYSVYDKTNPFILGHWYGTLGNMWKTKVGSQIYICVDGNIDTYEVVNSEYGVLRGNEIDIVGELTKINVWDTYGSRLNSRYFREDYAHGGVDRWKDVDDGKTLHMYTCHYGEGKVNWNSKHGHNGRWIVLANLIDSRPVSN